MGFWMIWGLVSTRNGKIQKQSKTASKREVKRVSWASWSAIDSRISQRQHTKTIENGINPGGKKMGFWIYISDRKFVSICLAIENMKNPSCPCASMCVVVQWVHVHFYTGHILAETPPSGHLSELAQSHARLHDTYVAPIASWSVVGIRSVAPGIRFFKICTEVLVLWLDRSALCKDARSSFLGVGDERLARPILSRASWP